MDDDGAVEARLRALAESVRAETPPPLTTSLRDAVEAAREILDCRYAAVSVIGVGGSTEHFETAGPPPGTRHEIGLEPTHRGPLGLVAREGEVVRIADIGADPRGIGELPSHHPAPRALLGVPVVLRGRPGGGLFLTDPRGRDEFGVEDEATAAVIAGAVAVAVERARTAAANQRRDRWTTGGSVLARELVSGTNGRPLRLIAQRVLDIAEADLVAVLRPDGEDGRLSVAAVAGTDSAAWKHCVLSREALGLGVTAGDAAAQVGQLSQRMGEVDPGAARRLRANPLDSTMFVPLNGTVVRGLLAIARRPGRIPFTAAELGMATMFAGQLALALDLAESLAHRDQVALIEERDRIARDLHDHVIQRLFAVGLTMQYLGTDRDADPLATRERVRASVDEIDDTIKQIRNTIYRLRGPILSPDSSLRTQSTRLLDDLESVLGFRPDLTIEGPVDFGVDEDLIDDCLAVLREALSNVARHAAATRAAVSIVLTATEVALQVTDNGRGLGETTRRSGLSNLRARAEQRGGSLAIETVGTGGTRLRWSAPMDAAPPEPGAVG
ncbi:MAG TPA: GAF domain-containing protein [Jatrophihabitans sp.]|uniref:GAF domain-containing sensor histidine kinase n=1 Tax=Jatrophihabitans sp. TaxID=1932789 RepID=UPI002E06075A|nr:GAF domain-containing protein [Jatrophihabitans sp.]